MRYPQIDVIFLVDADDEDEVIQRIQFVYLDKFDDVHIQSLHLDDLSTYPGPMPIQTIGMIWNNSQSDLTGTMASSIIVTSTSTMVVAVSEQTGSAFSETISKKIKIPPVGLCRSFGWDGYRRVASCLSCCLHL